MEYHYFGMCLGKEQISQSYLMLQVPGVVVLFGNLVSFTSHGPLAFYTYPSPSKS